MKGLRSVATAIRLSPRDPITGGTMARIAEAYLFQNEYETALEWAQRAMRNRQSPQIWIVVTLASILGHLERHDEAKHALSELLRLEPKFNWAFVKENWPITKPEYLAIYHDGLRKAGLPE